MFKKYLKIISFVFRISNVLQLLISVGICQDFIQNRNKFKQIKEYNKFNYIYLCRLSTL